MTGATGPGAHSCICTDQRVRQIGPCPTDEFSGSRRCSAREKVGARREASVSGVARINELAVGAAFVLGHNIVAFDLAHLSAADPNLKLLALPAVDTLRLNPLAFPRNPYHHLVKHYQDGQLRRAQVNDPLLDAQLALNLFQDQNEALLETQRTSPDLMCARMAAAPLSSLD